jgi:hypothetical protein
MHARVQEKSASSKPLELAKNGARDVLGPSRSRGTQTHASRAKIRSLPCDRSRCEPGRLALRGGGRDAPSALRSARICLPGSTLLTSNAGPRE